jgi:hypothetical protein
MMGVCATSTNPSNFNAAVIPQGYYIWFSSILQLSGDCSDGSFIVVQDQYIQLGSIRVPVPDGIIFINSAVSAATTIFYNNTWITTIPNTKGGPQFIAGLAYQAPFGGIPGALNPVTWYGTYSSSFQTGPINQQWAAAVYSSFTSDHNAIGVLPTDGSGDHAGTPVNFKPYVVGGARGGGGSNFCGSYSGTIAVPFCLNAAGISYLDPGRSDIADSSGSYSGPVVGSLIGIYTSSDPLLDHPFWCA